MQLFGTLSSVYLILFTLTATTTIKQSNAQTNTNVVLSLMELLQRGQNDLNLEYQDNQYKLLKDYDFIIVGAGTAGCALAARLSENPKWKILLLEAGGPESMIMDVPILAHFLQLGEMNWNYRTQPSNTSCLAMNNNRCNWPRGKVMGGSSVLNYMMYTRGNRRDYDHWAELGNDGWSYKDVLPYFKKFEGSTVPDAEPDMVGRNGPVRVSYVNWRSKIADAFVEAAEQDGLKYRDYNGRIQTGVSYLQTTTYKAMRWSSNRAYLYPLKGKRPNLHVMKYALVTKVLINEPTTTAFGVLVSARGKTYKFLAKREVILSAGAINTPQLLMLSGVGPAKHLREVGIKPIADLAVGYNLQDHIAPAITLTTNATSIHLTDVLDARPLNDFMRGKGMFGSPGVETIAFWDLAHPDKDDGWSDIELFMTGGSINENPAILRAFGLKQKMYEEFYEDIIKNGRNAFMIFPMILRPKSRGRIMLKSNNPFKYPLIYPNYFAHPYDLDIAVGGLQKIINLTQHPAFEAINAKVLNKKLPGCMQYDFNSYDYLACYARYFTLTIYHYAGTAKMGPKTDRSAVVDARLRVHGIKNFRVVDGSIMPELIAGHPNGPIFMIAEKAADMIKADHNYV